MTKIFLLINTILIPYHASVVIAMAMSMAQAQTNQEIVNNLYWIIPMNLVFASIPNFLIVMIYLLQKKTVKLFNVLIKAELYVVLIQLLLHGALLLLYSSNSNA